MEENRVTISLQEYIKLYDKSNKFIKRFRR